MTRAVGSMWMAYAFTLLALAGLPSALHPGGEGLVAWIAQTFLQLVLLSVIMVGQDVQSQSTEARDLETHDAVMAELAILKEEQKELKELAGALGNGRLPMDEASRLMEPTAWMDDDNEHFWWLHDCDSEHGHWARSAGFKPETMLPLGGSGWTVVSKDPLTISPSILCPACGTHGFIRAGKWVPA